jgi:glutamate N-acetyltransferase / amino-acid N-acetyltransferase
MLLPDGEWRVVPGSVTAPRGFKAAGMHSGMRAGTKADLALVTCEKGAIAAGVYTQNVMCAAPVTITKRVLMSNNKAIKAVCNPTATSTC